MLTVSEMFPSLYVAAADLRGQPLAVTIDRVAHEVVDPGTGERAYVLFFLGHKRGLRLNRINARTIGKIHGVETSAWAGKAVELYPTLTTFKSEEVVCIRVRASAQDPAPTGTTSAHDAAPAVAAATAPAPPPTPAPQVAPQGGEPIGSPSAVTF